MRPLLSIAVGVALLPLLAQQSPELKRAITGYEDSKNLRIEHRLPSILAFAKVREPASARFLEEVYQKEMLPEAKEAALEALGKMEIPAAAEVLFGVVEGDPSRADDVAALLAEATDPDVRDLVYERIQGKGAKSQAVRLAAVQIIGGYGDERALEALGKSAKDRSADVRAATAKALSRMETDESVEILGDLVLDKDRSVASAAIVAIGLRPDSMPKKLIDRALESKFFEVRAESLEILEGKTDDWVFQAAREALEKDKAWQVQVVAVKVLTSMRQHRVVEVLIAALEKAQGRLLDDLHKSLIDLTGLRMAAVHGDWDGWYKANKDTFEIRDEEGDVVDAPERRPAADQATYYGKVVHSKKVVFVLDFSASMKEEYIAPGTKVTQEPGKETAKVRKIDVARTELKNFIEKLKPKTQFNVIYFNAQAQPWKGSIQPATPPNKKAALEFIDKGEPFGVTNMYDAVSRALGDLEADTMYLLTDGVPTAGKYKHPNLNELKLAIDELNEHRRMSINCISFGSQQNAYKWFLEAIAKDNWGEFIER